MQIRGLLEFLRCQPDSNAVFCCDDRFVTGYPRFGTAPVVGIFEILRALRDARALLDIDYFEKLIHLRNANAMFLPIEADEVLFHLKRAPIVDGRVVETHPLSVLRRYVARVALQECRLKIGDFPPIESDRPDETHVLIGNRRLTDECLTKLWSSKMLKDEQCTAWATWVWSQLRMERHLGEHPSIKRDPESLATLVAVSFSAALSAVIQLAIGHSKSRKEAFAGWLLDIVVRNRLRIDSALTNHLVAQFDSLLDGVFAPDVARAEEAYSDEDVIAYLRQALDVLPEEVRERLLRSAKLRQRLKTKLVTVVNIGEVQLLQDRFIAAIRRAMESGKSQAKAHESSSMVTFQAIGPTGTVAVKCNGKTAQINDRAFPLLKCTSESQIRSFLYDHIEWFDRVQAEREVAVEEIVGVRSAEKRFQILDMLRRQSLAFHYQEIKDQLEESHSVPLAKCKPPRPEDVIRHLRLNADGASFADRWASAADCLMTDYCLEEAFLRLGCLPVPLPQAFIDRFTASTDEAQESLFSRFAQLGSSSPVHFFHALSLANNERTSSRVRDPALRLVTEVLLRWNDLADAMSALLTWTETHAHEIQGWPSYSAEEQLVTAWYHATRLMCILNRGLRMEAQISEHFAKVRGALSADAAFGGLSRSLDCASPTTFVGVVFLYGGMSYAQQTSRGSALLSAEHQEKILELTRVNGHVNPWLFASRELSANRLDSFLRVDAPVHSLSFTFPPSVPEDFENELLNAFPTAPCNPMLWVHLNTLARMGLRAATRQRLVELVANVQLLGLAELEDDFLIAWRSVAGCVRLLGDSATRETFKAQLLQLAKTLNDRFKRNQTPINVDAKDERGRRLNELLESCIAFSRDDDIAQAYANISELLIGVAAVWGTARAAICRTLETIYDESRMSENGAVWNALVRVRAQT